MEVRQRALADLAAACRDAQETCCLELFRRAVAERNHAAWEAVMTQYAGLVRAWVRRHPSSGALTPHERDEDWVTAAFERFWSAIAPERFGQFGGLPQLLRYLKLCVHSALVDTVRARAASMTVSLSSNAASGVGRQRDGFADHALDPNRAHGALHGAPHGVLVADAEALAVDQLAASDLWQAIGRELVDDDERLIARLSFVLDLKPAEIHERHPNRFAAVADVYRIKRNLLERLRRSDAILSLAGMAASRPEEIAR